MRDVEHEFLKGSQLAEHELSSLHVGAWPLGCFSLHGSTVSSVQAGDRASREARGWHSSTQLEHGTGGENPAGSLNVCPKCLLHY